MDRHSAFARFAVLAFASTSCAHDLSFLEAGAAVQVFADRGAFVAASPPLATVEFEGIAQPGTVVRFGTAAGLTLGGATFVGLAADGRNHELYVQSDTYVVSTDWGTGDSLIGDRFRYLGGVGGHVAITPPAGTTAIGTDFMTVLTDRSRPSSRCRFSVTAGGIVSEFFAMSNGTRPAFIGFVSARPITRVEFATTAGSGDASPYGVLDNVSFGHP